MPNRASLATAGYHDDGAAFASDHSPLYGFFLIIVLVFAIIKTFIHKSIVYTFRFLKKIVTGKEYECVFCGLHKLDDEYNTIVLYRDEICYIVEDIRPEAEFHYLVIPFKHIPSRRKIEDLETLRVVKHMKIVGQQFAKRRHYELWNEMSSNGIAEDRTGFHLPPFNSVEHLHMHILVGKFKNYLSKLEFTPNTYWYTTCDDMIEDARSKKKSM
ncbi:hypothetical protein C9374_008234 [Naegleria lovaniensis]|uniref:HIT domain-containing protein n=1 Tax=Naegleria lovaniensis TaxID=51637 RepID=A0AA88KGF4_NAELO|nr:uncharacterized protein C9374_008234 [Naegleria lovaniensis]KAG2378595.1 hypothetical protein C9374_008234 [Naegleria lovaniensis]